MYTKSPQKGLSSNALSYLSSLKESSEALRKAGPVEKSNVSRVPLQAGRSLQKDVSMESSILDENVVLDVSDLSESSPDTVFNNNESFMSSRRSSMLPRTNSMGPAVNTVKALRKLRNSIDATLFQPKEKDPISKSRLSNEQPQFRSETRLDTETHRTEVEKPTKSLLMTTKSPFFGFIASGSSSAESIDFADEKIESSNRSSRVSSKDSSKSSTNRSSDESSSDSRSSDASSQESSRSSTEKSDEESSEATSSTEKEKSKSSSVSRSSATPNDMQIAEKLQDIQHPKDIQPILQETPKKVKLRLQHQENLQANEQIGENLKPTLSESENSLKKPEIAEKSQNFPENSEIFEEIGKNSEDFDELSSLGTSVSKNRPIFATEKIFEKKEKTVLPESLIRLKKAEIIEEIEEKSKLRPRKLEKARNDRKKRKSFKENREKFEKGATIASDSSKSSQHSESDFSIKSRDLQKEFEKMRKKARSHSQPAPRRHCRCCRYREEYEWNDDISSYVSDVVRTHISLLRELAQNEWQSLQRWQSTIYEVARHRDSVTSKRLQEVINERIQRSQSTNFFERL